MPRSTLTHLVAVALCLNAGFAEAAEECPRPNVRTTNALVTAIALDETMATGFDTAATACNKEGPACDEAKVKCGTVLTTTMQQQLSFDEGAYLRDMLIAYAGQQYKMIPPIPAGMPLTDVSCNSDATTLRAAAGEGIVPPCGMAPSRTTRSMSPITRGWTTSSAVPRRPSLPAVTSG